MQVVPVFTVVSVGLVRAPPPSHTGSPTYTCPAGKSPESLREGLSSQTQRTHHLLRRPSTGRLPRATLATSAVPQRPSNTSGRTQTRAQARRCVPCPRTSQRRRLMLPNVLPGCVLSKGPCACGLHSPGPSPFRFSSARTPVTPRRRDSARWGLPRTATPRWESPSRNRTSLPSRS